VDGRGKRCRLSDKDRFEEQASVLTHGDTHEMPPKDRLEQFLAILGTLVEGLDVHVELDTLLVDLGVDSVAIYSLIGRLEELYSVHFTDDELLAVRTVGDVLRLLPYE
jgi:acyl carrier protein